MASQPLPLGGEVLAFPAVAPMPAVARILARHTRANVEAFIAIAIDLLDTFDGSPDAEDDDPGEVVGDEQDAAWIEWTALHPATRRGPAPLAGDEDSEDDDQDTCLTADDQGSAGGRWFDTDGWPGDDQDEEDNGDREAAES